MGELHASLEEGGGGDGENGDKKTNPDEGGRYKKRNGDMSKDYAHSNGVKNGDGGGGVRKRNVKEDVNDDLVTPEDLEQYIPEPPDGGWGWVIVFASVINNLIVDGIGYTFGVFLMEFVDAFQSTSSKVSLVGSLLCGTYLFAGPLVSAMTNKFGCRPVVMVGSLIATVAFLLATRAPTIEVLILTYGVMGGFGLGMMYLPSIVSVGYYFQTKRAFATGLAVAGSGLGTFIFPPLSEILLETYDWRGSLMVIAGIIFNGCVTGALMRPLQAKRVKCKDNVPRKKSVWDRIQQRIHRDSSQWGSSMAAGDEIAAGVQEAKLRREKKLQDTDSVLGSVPSIARHRIDSITTNDGRNKKLSTTSSELPDSPSTNASSPSSPKITIEFQDEDGSKVSEDVIVLPHSDAPKHQDAKDGKEEGNATNTSTRSPSQQRGSGRGSELSPLLEVPDGSASKANVLPAGCGGSRSNLYHLSSMRSLHLSKKDLAKDLARPMYRKDIFYSASVQNIPQYHSQPDVKSYIASVITLPGEKDYLDGGATASSKCINGCCSCLPRSARDTLSEMIDISLFKDISFLLICLGNFLAFLGFFVPFVFMVDKAVDAGITKKDATFLISIIGIANTVGRVAVGKLVDHKILDSLIVSYVSIALCGIVCALTPFCDAYGLLAVNALLFGSGVAAFVSMSSIIICDRIGVEKLTNGFGLLCMVRGLAGMMGPPLAGKLYDSTKTYNLSFYIAGVSLLLGAACHMFLHLPCLRKPNPNLPPDFVMEEIDPEEYGMQPVGKEQPQILTVNDITSDDKEN